MSFMNALKGAIWEQDPNATPQAQPQAPVAQSTSRPVGSTAPMVSSVNDEMVQAIKRNTLSRKTPYTALLEAADKLANVIPDPNMRLKAAYAMVGEQRTVEAIMKALDIHISDVDGEKMRFGQATDQRRKTELGSLTTQLTQLNTSTEQMQTEITNLHARIQQLNTTINDNTVKANELAAQVNSRGAEYDATVAQFENAAQLVRGELEQQRIAISSTLSS
jgi:chromosome segregation ATPase